MKSYRYFDIILGVFIAVLLTSNFASSAKIVDFGFGIFGIPMAFDAGTILFPIGYVFGDILTEVYGYQRSRRVIWTGFFSLALAAFVFWVVGRLLAHTKKSTLTGNRVNPKSVPFVIHVLSRANPLFAPKLV